ncbi:twin-arginine translocase subunit TatC [Pedobacter sp. MW01-1-1]|uniref:twin-arginine translocase subunit TatC n=1 Tax=Pedobacter sp. MW01-1-1 TaxID=3383027 RepID=UPI003FF14EB3
MSNTKERSSLLKAVTQKGKTMEAEMSFFDHLDVLRKHLIRAVIAIAVFSGGAFYFMDEIIDKIIFGPKKPDFWTYRMMCKLVEKYPSLGQDMCITKINGEIINTEMAGQFNLQLNVGVMVGIVLGFPYLLWEIWRFVKPALHENERKSASGFVFFASILFIIGILFGYFIVCALSVNFLTGYDASSEIKNMFSIDSYISSVATLTLGTGIIFELPIIIFILSKLGLMTPKLMRSSRRYATVIILIIAAVVTPTPDIMTMLIVAAPLFLLYELSIFVSAYIYRKKQKAEAAFYNS